MWSFSPFQNRVALSLSPQNLVVPSYSLQNRVAPYLLRSRVVSYLLQNHMALFLSPQNLVVPSLYGRRASV